MIRCVTNGRSAIVFRDTETGRFEHFRLEDLDTTGGLRVAGYGTQSEELQAVLLPLLREHPEWVEPFVDREYLDVFCQCGGYSFELTSGTLTCSECGERHEGGEAFPTLLVSELFAGAKPGKKEETDGGDQELHADHEGAVYADPPGAGGGGDGELPG